jgi:hypothetical protein
MTTAGAQRDSVEVIATWAICERSRANFLRSARDGFVRMTRVVEAAGPWLVHAGWVMPPAATPRRVVPVVCISRYASDPTHDVR